MKTYIKSQSENKTQVKLIKFKEGSTIQNNKALRDYLNHSLNQLFEDKELFMKQKPYAFKNILKELKGNKMVDDRLVYSVNLLIRNISSFTKVLQEEVKSEDGKVKNYIPTTNYRNILDSLILFTLDSSFNKIIKTTLKVSK